ncbi:hypothetical protein [Corynebacterium nuruki]|uniref:hypothetical protein n=1 Tax=Corynebacterium nuruki TaxID=1032851 RepID=UPI0039BFDCE6
MSSEPAGSEEWAAKSAAWVRNEQIYDRVFAPFTRALLTAADRPGALGADGP